MCAFIVHKAVCYYRMCAFIVHKAVCYYRMCAFIVHKAEDKYYAHVFHCDPSAGPLCKTIEAACKVRIS